MNNRIPTWGAAIIAATLAAGIGFTLHVFSAEVITEYVAATMAGRHVAPSWDIRIPAALSSIEQGLALVVLYLLLRLRFPWLSTLWRGLLVTMLALALGGNLIRQPMMDLLIGNPLSVVAVQDGITWLIWIIMGLIVATCLDLMMPIRRSSEENGH